MSHSKMDVEMSSPPGSPRPAMTKPDTSTHSRSKPMPITSQSAQRQRGRFQPAIPNNSNPAFTPIATHSTSSNYPQNMFKPKNYRGPAAPAHPTHLSSQQHHQSQSTSPFTPITKSRHTQQAQHTILPSSAPTSDLPTPNHSVKGRSMKRTAPLQIPQSAAPTASMSIASTCNDQAALPATTPTTTAINLSLPASLPIPQSITNISPSFPATLFGGLSADDEHVTVWEPATGKTVAGNAAPYRRNLQAWLTSHPGWEEKADELKSSKRRSAARRSRSAAEAFAALCCYPVATFLANDAATFLHALGEGDHCNDEAMMQWTTDDFVRLQEALFRLGQECHSNSCSPNRLDDERWAQVTAQIGGSKLPGTVVYCAHHMLTRGIMKSQRELAGNTSLPSSIGAITIGASETGGMASPPLASSYDPSVTGGESYGGPSSMPTLQGGLSASFLERSFRAPREPRVTVWNPSNGRTISGNAAPCRRNLEAWMRDHPGWCPKEEGQLSSSRRNRNKKIRPSSLPSAEVGPSSVQSVEPESPLFHDALEGLLFLSKSPSAVSPPKRRASVGVKVIPAAGRREGGVMSSSMAGQTTVGGNNSNKKIGMTSSVSSSSAEDGRGMSDGEENGEDGDTSKMEL